MECVCVCVSLLRIQSCRVSVCVSAEDPVVWSVCEHL